MSQVCLWNCLVASSTRTGFGYAISPSTLFLEVDDWRSCDRYLLHYSSGAAEHGEPDCKLLIYNQHQLNSGQFPFSAKMQVRLCEAVYEDAIAHIAHDETIVGFVFGVDAGCSVVTWTNAMPETLKIAYPSFLQSGNKHVILAAERFSQGERFKIHAQEQDGCLLFGWSFRARLDAVEENLGADACRGPCLDNVESVLEKVVLG